MISRRTLISLLVLPIPLALAAPAAEAARHVKSAAPFRDTFFEARIDGVQTDTWQRVSPGSGGCDPAVRDGGTEVIRFSRRPFAVRVRYFQDRRSAPVIDQWGSGGGHRATAVVTRTASSVADPPAEGCEPLGEPGRTFAGCGTKTIRSAVLLGYSPAPRRAGQLISLTGENGDSPFEDCPGGDFRFPGVIESDTAGRPMVAKLARADVFDRRRRHIVLVGGGRKVTGGPGAAEEVTLSWKVSLKRIKSRKDVSR